MDFIIWKYIFSKMLYIIVMCCVGYVFVFEVGGYL